MSDLAVVSGATVRNVLDGNEDLVLRAVARAYLAHAKGETQVPATYPLFEGGGRFVAMPASIRDEQPVVGVKWVASFVGNVKSGAERASALLIVNDAATGRPIAVVDGTLISARRTAAAAALALREVVPPQSVRSIGLVGCGPINHEVLRFLEHLYPLEHVASSDVDPARTEAFRDRLPPALRAITSTSQTLDAILETADAVSIATNTMVPHIAALPARPFVLLHLSLRDLAPAVI